MNISAIDIELLKSFIQLDESQKKSLLQFINSFLKNDIMLDQRVSVEYYNHELDEALKKVLDGEFTTLEDLEKEMKSW